MRHLPGHESGLSLDGETVLSRPGHRRVCSDRGIELVAEIVSTRTHKPFEALLADEVKLPLGMRHTSLRGSPASGAVRSLRDLVALAGELLVPSIIDAELLTGATQTVFRG